MEKSTDDATPDFKPDYELLEISDRSDWKTARANYRRLVHLWHPDRYAQRPREREHAQRQFISLTKSYNNLRTFHRANGRLPFEPPKPRKPSVQIGEKANKLRRPAHEARHTNTDREATIETGILGRKDSASTRPDRSGIRKLLWISTAAALLVVTMSVFFVLDRRSNQRIIEAGRETIRQAPSSDFMPSAADIRRSESRGAFVQPDR